MAPMDGTIFNGTPDDDTYYVDNIDDVVLEEPENGTDEVIASIDYTLPENVENLTLTETAVSGTGNGLANLILGDDMDNVIDGGSNIDASLGDTMAGGKGDDTYNLKNGPDSVLENENEGTDTVVSPFDFTLPENVENLTLTETAVSGTGNGLANWILGDDMDNVIDGGSNFDAWLGDTMAGGKGDDTYNLKNGPDSVLENENEGTDTVVSPFDFTLPENVENLTLTETAIQGAGNDFPNLIIGNDQDNYLIGWTNADESLGDTMEGGKGNDTYYVTNINHLVVENEDEGTDTVESLRDYALPANVENLTLMDFSVRGTGNELANVIIGDLENNIIDGVENADPETGDTMSGGEGDDIYYVHNTHDEVIENGWEGTDKVISSIDYILPDFVENLTLTGSARRGVGNGSANYIVANDLGDSLDGGGGNDTLVGGAGADTLEGGDGVNLAVIASSLQNFTVYKTDEGYAVQEKGAGPEGLDLLKNIKYVRFGAEIYELAALVETGPMTPISPSLNFSMNPGVRESSPVNTIYGVVKASGFTPSAELSYSIAGGEDSQYFTIGTYSGEIYLTVPLDEMEKKGPFHVSVHVSDGFFDKSLDVTLDPDHSLNLVFSSDASVDFSSINAGSDFLFKVSAYINNGPSHSAITYSIVGGADQDKFRIDQETGDLQLLNPSDAAIGAHRYEIIVQASTENETASASATQTVDINFYPDKSAKYAPVAPTGNPYVDGLLRGSKWDSPSDVDKSFTTLTFSFPTTSDQDQYVSAYKYSNNSQSNLPEGFSAITDQLKNLIISNLKWFGSIAKINFVDIEDTPNGAAGVADLRFAFSDKIDLNTYAMGNFPETKSLAGDVWLNPTYFKALTDFTPQIGTALFLTLFHEIGHALGLKHLYEGSQKAPFPEQVDHWSAAYSMMQPTLRYGYIPSLSQRLFAFDDANGVLHSPMMDDIRALQTLYGANYAAHGGDTTYRWDPDTGVETIDENDGRGPVAQGVPALNRIFMTVWDGDGKDTYDFSAYATNLIINLQPGAWSTLSKEQLARTVDNPATNTPYAYAPGNVANAYLFNDDPRSLIENAIGGSGDDRMTGNQANNVLIGGAGDDQLFGLEGNDTLDGGLGADTIDGGVGVDIAVYQATRAEATIIRNADGSVTVSSAADGVDQVSNVEYLQFSDQLVHLAPKGDLNGDGRSDILLRDGATGDCYVWEMDGVKLLGDNSFGYVGWRPPHADWKVAGTGDFNGDGKSDILLRDGSNGDCYIWEMDGVKLLSDTSYGYVGWTPPTNHWRVAGTGDFDGDGKSDILLQDGPNGDCYIWEMNGLSLKTDGYGYVVGQTSVGLGASVKGTGDFDGDGKCDILLQDANGDCFVWLMDGLTATASAKVGWTPPTADWRVAGVGDFGGDGRSDIFLQEGGTGDCYVWEMDGLNLKQDGYGYVGWRPPNADWHATV